MLGMTLCLCDSSVIACRLPPACITCVASITWYDALRMHVLKPADGKHVLVVTLLASIIFYMCVLEGTCIHSFVGWGLCMGCMLEGA
jgi:hypothetical protein